MEGNVLFNNTLNTFMITWHLTYGEGPEKKPGTFLIPASAARLVWKRLWYVLSRLWDGAYKRTIAANWRE